MDLPINVALKRPIVLGENTYDKLSFDEPDLACQIAYAELEATLSKPPKPIDAARVNRFWIARLAGVSEAVAEKIKSSDLEAVNAAVEVAMGIADDKGADAGDASGNEAPVK